MVDTVLLALIFERESDIDDLLFKLFAGTLPKSTWTHPEHLSFVAAWLWENPATALDHLRAAANGSRPT